jgi:hypothetical protein
MPMFGKFPDLSSKILLSESDDKVDELLCHMREKGVYFQNYLLTKAVLLRDSELQYLIL